MISFFMFAGDHPLAATVMVCFSMWTAALLIEDCLQMARWLVEHFSGK